MRLQHDDHGSTIVLTIDQARLDWACSRAFSERAAEMIEASHNRCVLNLQNVTFIDSSGIGALVALLKHMGRDRSLELCAPQPTVRKVLRLTRLDAVFRITPNLQASVGVSHPVELALAG